jgi:hypothetical protein
MAPFSGPMKENDQGIPAESIRIGIEHAIEKGVSIFDIAIRAEFG